MTVERNPDDDALRTAARALHTSWDSPELWPSIERQMRRSPAWRWRQFAAAAALVLAAGTAGWLTWQTLTRPGSAGSGSVEPGSIESRQERLLSDAAYAEVERSEQRYTQAIDDLSRLVAPKLEMPESELLVALRERLQAIDAAIAESRAQIEQNPFNAQLRRQLLYIYQEKRQTLEQIQEHDDTAL